MTEEEPKITTSCTVSITVPPCNGNHLFGKFEFYNSAGELLETGEECFNCHEIRNVRSATNQ